MGHITGEFQLFKVKNIDGNLKLCSSVCLMRSVQNTHRRYSLFSEWTLTLSGCANAAMSCSHCWMMIKPHALRSLKYSVSLQTLTVEFLSFWKAGLCEKRPEAAPYWDRPRSRQLQDKPTAG